MLARICIFTKLLFKRNAFKTTSWYMLTFKFIKTFCKAKSLSQLFISGSGCLRDFIVNSSLKKARGLACFLFILLFQPSNKPGRQFLLHGRQSLALLTWCRLCRCALHLCVKHRRYFASFGQRKVIALVFQP